MYRVAGVPPNRASGGRGRQEKMVEGNSREEQMRGRNERRDEKGEGTRGGQILIDEDLESWNHFSFCAVLPVTI